MAGGCHEALEEGVPLTWILDVDMNALKAVLAAHPEQFRPGAAVHVRPDRFRIVEYSKGDEDGAVEGSVRSGAGEK